MDENQNTDSLIREVKEHLHLLPDRIFRSEGLEHGPVNSVSFVPKFHFFSFHFLELHFFFTFDLCVFNVYELSLEQLNRD